MDSNIEILKNVLSKLEINIKEYNKIEKIVNSIKNDNEIKDTDKLKIFIHINNVFFNEKSDNKKNEIKDKSIKKGLCKKCEKNKFKKYDFCYKHCQEEDIIPKHIKRKDFDEYKKRI